LGQDFGAGFTAIPNSALQYSTITVGGTSTALGGSVLGNVTNDTQTKASIVPNTTPSSGQILVGNAGSSAYAAVLVSGDVGLSYTGAITVNSIGGKTITLAGSLTTTGANSLTFTTTATTVATLPAGTVSLGYLGVPQNHQNANYTTVASDAGQHLYYDGSSGYTWTIAANSSVAYHVGDAITFVNNGSTSVTIAIASDTLLWSPSGGTGSRTLAKYGMATAMKVGTTLWMLSGTGLT
jgi:hypothetical protein